MSVMTLQRAMRPNATLARTFLITAAAVLGILIGLLGMHVLSTGSMHHAPAVVSEHSHHDDQQPHLDPMVADATTGADDGTTQPCGDDGCEHDMDAMAFMACVLALLAVSIVLAIRPSRIATAHRAQSPPVSIAAVVEAQPVPPDLNVLSISRT